jgi:hypothetical protein
MAAPNYTIGFTQAEVEAILAVHKAELLQSMASFSESGSSVTRLRMEEINSIIGACQTALQRFDPESYGTTNRNRTAVSSVSGHLPK